uniref:Uncharacterized protein n=1 Tax=Oryza nivara TaxID=4536 RepID=A0A0E0IYF5_ORYNI
MSNPRRCSLGTLSRQEQCHSWKETGKAIWEAKAREDAMAVQHSNVKEGIKSSSCLPPTSQLGTRRFIALYISIDSHLGDLVAIAGVTFQLEHKLISCNCCYCLDTAIL